MTPLSSPATRLLASEWKTIKRPVLEMFGSLLSSLPLATGGLDWLTRTVVAPAASAGATIIAVSVRVPTPMRKRERRWWNKLTSPLGRLYEMARASLLPPMCSDVPRSRATNLEA